MPDESPDLAFVLYAKDSARVAEFYRRALEMDLVEDAADFIVLRTAGFELTVLRIPAHIAADIEITSPPAVREETPIKPAFTVASLERVRAAIRSTGGQLGPPESAWRHHGSLHLDGWDPEGNVVQFRQVES